MTVLAIEGDSTKGSALGAAADVVYTFADGITTMTITYALYSAQSTSYNVGLAGGNAPAFKAVSTTAGGFLSGYTYMTPITTITPA